MIADHNYFRKFMPIPASTVGSYEHLQGDNTNKGLSGNGSKFVSFIYSYTQTNRLHRGLIEPNSLLYRCGVLDCGKGFATAHDLVRHQVSVHRMRSGGARMYRCFGAGCAKPEKDWPRKDNFRSHLKKAHPDEDVDALVRKSDEWWDKMYKFIKTL